MLGNISLGYESILSNILLFRLPSKPALTTIMVIVWQCHKTYLACGIIVYDSAQRYKQSHPLHKVTWTKNTITNIYV